MDRTLDEAVAGFDDDALLKMMVALVARTFPKFEGAPEPVKRARDRFVALASAAPRMRTELADMINLARSLMVDANNHGYEYDVETELANARAALRAADGEE